MDPIDAQTELPESWAVSACRNHPEKAAEAICSRCAAEFCADCVKTHRVGNQLLEFCPLCGGRCGPKGATSQSFARGEENFYSRLPSVFVAPFRGNGPIILIGGTIFFGLLNIAGFLPFIGLFVSVFGAGYMAAYLLSVITTSARGDEELPTWPDFTDFWNDIIQPCLLLAGTMALCLGPAIAYRVYAAFWPDAPEWPYWALLAAGGFYLPMALLGVALCDGLHGVNPLVGFRSIALVPGPYLVTCLVLGLLYGAGELGARLWSAVPIVGALVAGFVSLYLAVVQMRLLGTLYHANRDRLNWF